MIMATNNLVKKYVLEIEQNEDQVKALNEHKSDIYKDAKTKDINVPALKKLIARRRKGIDKHEAEEEIIQSYLAELD